VPHQIGGRNAAAHPHSDKAVRTVDGVLDHGRAVPLEHSVNGDVEPASTGAMITSRIF
jgi:hypothetical protein